VNSSPVLGPVATPLVRLSWIGLAIAGLELLVGATLVLSPNDEGWLGGLLFAAFYAVPAALIALALRSGVAWQQMAAGWLSLLLAVGFGVVPIGNWSGYVLWQAVLAVGVTIPVVVFYLVAFWTVVIRHRGQLGTPGAVSGQDDS